MNTSNNTLRTQANANKLIMITLKNKGVTKDCSLRFKSTNAGVKIGSLLLTTVKDAIVYSKMWVSAEGNVLPTTK